MPNLSPLPSQPPIAIEYKLDIQSLWTKYEDIANPMRRAADIIGNQIAAAMAGKSAEVVQIETGRRKS